MTKTILLADDSLTIQKVVELTFADTPYTVVSVSSGDELLDRLPEVRPDLIICDIIMPGRDGYDVCQDIKSSPDTLHIPVILLSGTFEPLDRNRALAVGCSEILSKPFEARKLIDSVDRLLSGAEGPPAGAAAGASVRNAEADVAAPESGSDLGTRLTDAPADTGELEPDADELAEGLDFTETGFAEMEAAASPPADASMDLPREALDFDLSSGEVDPFADLDTGDDSPLGGDLGSAFDAAGGPFSDGSVFDEPDEGPGDGEGPGDDEPPRPSDADTGPAFAPEPMEAEHAMELDDEPLAAAPQPEPEPEQEPELELGAAPAFTADTDTAPLPPIDEPTTPEPATVDLPAAAVGASLSDEDVDRIARRLLELADDRIQQIAWEVIPDVAEVVVRERIRKLEAEHETDS